MSDYRIVINTYAGLEPVLEQELRLLGARDIKQHMEAVSCKGDIGFVYKANFGLRTALSVMVTLNNFKFRDDNDLFNGVKGIEWSEFIKPGQKISITGTLAENTEIGQLDPVTKAKEAIADYFKDKFGSAPDFDAASAEVNLSIFIQKYSCSVLLNSSGSTLNHRGYRQSSELVAMDEVMAAGLIMLAGWSGPRPFVDFVCGIGLLPVEAALIAAKIPPGVFRKKYAFEEWPIFNQELYTLIRDKQISRIADTPVKIFANEPVVKVSDIAYDNISAAGVEDMVILTSEDYRDFNPPGQGIVVLNPEMEGDDLPVLYKEIGDTLKNKYTGFAAWIYSGAPEAPKWLGLRPGKTFNLFNGTSEYRFTKYELFDGNKKDFYAEKYGQK